VKRFRSKDGPVGEYLYIVKVVRVGGKPCQKVVVYRGRDELRKDDSIDSPVEGLSRYAERARVLAVVQYLGEWEAVKRLLL